MNTKLLESDAYWERSQALEKVCVGDIVQCNGHPGKITKLCEGQLIGMVEVKLESGYACVDVEDLECNYGEIGQ